MQVKISPSLMCMDLLHIEREIKALEAKADYFHIDVIDWHYCKNMSLTPCFVEAISRITKVPQDVHLYVDNIELDLIEWCLDCGAQIITLPPEVVANQVMRIIRYIKSRNCRVGFFINPSTGLETVKPYIGYIDRITVMTVDPGFAGQEFVPESLEKIRQARSWKEAKGYHYEIACDGNCNEKYYKALYQAGCEVFILGSTGLFGKASDTRKAIEIAEKEILDEITD